MIYIKSKNILFNTFLHIMIGPHLFEQKYKKIHLMFLFGAFWISTNQV